MSFWRTYYHLVWATKNRQPFITDDRELSLYPYISGKCKHLGGIVHQIGGIENHIHLIVSIPPRISVSDFVQHIKGSSAHYLNDLGSPEVFAWQLGYGVFTLSKNQLEPAIEYVANQKQHHAQKTTIPALEQDGWERSGHRSPT
jgi:putative transposase